MASFSFTSTPLPPPSSDWFKPSDSASHKPSKQIQADKVSVSLWQKIKTVPGNFLQFFTSFYSKIFASDLPQVAIGTRLVRRLSAAEASAATVGAGAQKQSIPLQISSLIAKFNEIQDISQCAGARKDIENSMRRIESQIAALQSPEERKKLDQQFASVTVRLRFLDSVDQVMQADGQAEAWRSEPISFSNLTNSFNLIFLTGSKRLPSPEVGGSDDAYKKRLGEWMESLKQSFSSFIKAIDRLRAQAVISRGNELNNEQNEILKSFLEDSWHMASFLVNEKGPIREQDVLGIEAKMQNIVQQWANPEAKLQELTHHLNSLGQHLSEIEKGVRGGTATYSSDLKAELDQLSASLLGELPALETLSQSSETVRKVLGDVAILRNRIASLEETLASGMHL